MGTLGSLGINLPLLAAQAVNFVLLLVVLDYLVYRPLVARIEADEATLQAAVKERARLSEDKDRFRTQQESELAALAKKVNAAIDEANDIASDIKQRAREEAEQERAAVVAQIKNRLRELEYGSKSAA